MMLSLTTMKSKEATLPIKKEIQDFVIATENLYRLLAHSEALTCHEAEILRCCLEELSDMEDAPPKSTGSVESKGTATSFSSQITDEGKRVIVGLER